MESAMNIFYIIGVVVVVLIVAGFLGLHVWMRPITVRDLLRTKLLDVVLHDEDSHISV